MLPNLIEKLRCPRCRLALVFRDSQGPNSQADEGILRCDPCGGEYPIIGGIPRFVSSGGYAETFGRQWRTFRREQLDSFIGTTLSHDRFYQVTRWRPEELAGKWVLDVGCGAGRFAEIALEAGANVIAMDISSSVEACYDNLIQRFPDRLHVVQASIYEMPFEAESFEYVYCIGVIQHTPDPLAAVDAVARMSRPNGRVGLWIYERRWCSFLGIYAWKYGLRIITRRLSFRENYLFAFALTAMFWPIWYPLMHAGPLGKALLFWLPVPARAYVGEGYGLRDVFRCVAMDTLDMYSPAYDNPQRYADVVRTLQRNGHWDIVRTCTGLGLAAVRRKSLDRECP